MSSYRSNSIYYGAILLLTLWLQRSPTTALRMYVEILGNDSSIAIPAKSAASHVNVSSNLVLRPLSLCSKELIGPHIIPAAPLFSACRFRFSLFSSFSTTNWYLPIVQSVYLPTSSHGSELLTTSKSHCCVCAPRI